MLSAVLKIAGPLVTGFMQNRQKVSAAKADLKVQRLTIGGFVSITFAVFGIDKLFAYKKS